MDKKKTEYGVITEQGDLGLFTPLTEQEQQVLRDKDEVDKKKK